ncbi:MAG: glycosyltransferase [Betaproteobacteria bacterium]
MANPTTLNPASGRIHVLEVMGNAIVGGMESCVQRLIERLPRERFTVTALCPFEGAFTDRLRALDVEVVVTPMPENPHWCSIQLATALVKANAIDVLHAHLPNAHLLAALAGKLTGKPVLASIHGRQLAVQDIEVQRAAGTHLGVVCRQSYFHAIGVGINAAQVSYLPNGVDIETFKPGARPEGGLRAEFNIPSDAQLVGFVGRLAWEKGPEVFLHAAQLLRQLAPQAHFVMIGGGEMEPEVRAFIKAHGLERHVHLAGSRDDMPSIYRQFDVAVSTSHSEAMPLAIMEAMACGLPVVAIEVGGIPELVEQGQTGWLIRHEDFEGTARMVSKLLADPREIRRMGANARKRAVERFSLDASVERLAQVMTRLVPSRAEQRRIGTIAREQST